MSILLKFAEQLLAFELITLAFVLIYSCFLPFNTRYKKIHRFIAITVIALIYVVVYHLTETIEINILHIVLNKSITFMVLGLVHLLFSGRWYRRILVSIVCYTLALFSEVLPEVILYINLLGAPQGQQYQSVQAVLGIGIGCRILAIACVLKFSRRKTDLSVTRRFSFLQMAIAGICLVGTMLIVGEITITGQVAVRDAFLLFSYLILLILFYISFEKTDTVNKRNQQYALEQQRYELMDGYYKRVETHQNEIRTIKHDMKNQLLALAGHIQGKDDTIVNSQIDRLIDQLSAADHENFTTNPGLNALLGVKYRQALAEGIVCDFTVKLPKEIGIEQNDLAAIVGNVLDNAIEACTYCTGQKYIRFTLVYHHGAVVLASENSTDGSGKNLVTRKKDSKNHGIGMGNIKRIVMQYGGDMQHRFGSHNFIIESTLFEKA